MKTNPLISSLLRIKDINIAVADFYNAYFHQYSQEIDENIVKNQLKIHQKPELALYYSILEVMGIEENDPDFLEAKNICKIDHFTILNKETYTNNPYVKTIGKIKGTYKDWKLETHFYEPYEAFLWNEVQVDSRTFNEYSSIGFFLEKFKYLAITQNQVVWMSLTPHEIETMKEPLQKMHGNILVLGLGLGYFPFMASNNDEVTSITIVEKDASAIELFQNLILPHFPNKNKIQIIQDDAFSYLKKESDFDCCFVDLWRQVEDAFPLYLKAKYLAKKHAKTKFFYWIEESIICYIRRALLTLLEEYLLGTDENLYTKEKNDEDHLINSLYFLLKNKKLKSWKEFYSLLSSSSIRDLCDELNWDHSSH